MEAKWLEDFVSLAETRSFSRSAQLRNVTQPAFSRRIQALESWLGVDLVDRTSYPTRLTAPGETFYQQSLEILGQINATRSMLRGDERVARDTIEFAMPHTMALTFFPKWLTQLRPMFGRLSTRMMALNVHDAVLRLVEGGCDMLLVYHHPRQPVQLDPNRYEMLLLGHERVAPYSRCDRSGEPQYKLPGTKAHPIPFLAYTPNAYLGRMVDVILSENPEPTYLDKCYETDMSEALKVMAIEGHGVAFLPESSVAREVRSRMVAPAGPQWGLSMEVRLYRERSESSRDPRSNKNIVNQLWEHLQQKYDQRKLGAHMHSMQKTHTRMRK